MIPGLVHTWGQGVVFTVHLPRAGVCASSSCLMDDVQGKGDDNSDDGKEKDASDGDGDNGDIDPGDALRGRHAGSLLSREGPRFIGGCGEAGTVRSSAFLSAGFHLSGG